MGQSMKVLFSLISGNRKTGPIPVSITESKSCPTSCPLLNNGCYSAAGRMRIHWNRLDKSRKTKHSWKNFIKQVKGLFPGQFWRHNSAGDLVGTGNHIDKTKMMELINANKGRRGFTYTHKPVLGLSKQARKNAELIRVANEKGFIVNLSGDSLSHADQLSDLGVAPVVSIVPTDHPKHSFSPAGRKVLVCPEQTIGITCDQCMLCTKKDRKFIVAFRAHGVSKRAVSQRASLPILE